MSDNYEADVEAALASVKMASKAEKTQKELGEVLRFLDFMDTHPEFGEFYNLMKRADRF